MREQKLLMPGELESLQIYKLQAVVKVQGLEDAKKKLETLRKLTGVEWIITRV